MINYRMKSNAHYTEIAFVLDRSGSMKSCQQAAIDGFNRFLADQQKDRRPRQTDPCPVRRRIPCACQFGPRRRGCCRSPTRPTSRADAPRCSTPLARPSMISAIGSALWPKKTGLGRSLSPYSPTVWRTRRSGSHGKRSRVKSNIRPISINGSFCSWGPTRTPLPPRPTSVSRRTTRPPTSLTLPAQKPVTPPSRAKSDHCAALAWESLRFPIGST